MKYKVTDKHPYLKNNIITERQGDYRISYNTDDVEWSRAILLDMIDFNAWIEFGWIEEIQEPEFTKNDMVDFALEYYEYRFYNTNRQLDFKKIDTCLEDWIKNINHD